MISQHHTVAERDERDVGDISGVGGSSSPSREKEII